jgi:hypothetical protein
MKIEISFKMILYLSQVNRWINESLFQNYITLYFLRFKNNIDVKLDPIIGYLISLF